MSIPRTLMALLLTVLALPATAAAQVPGEEIAERLADLRQRRGALETELSAGTAAVERAAAAVSRAEGRLLRAAGALEEARAAHVGRLEELTRAREELRAVRDRLEERVQEMYVEGAIGSLELLLSLGSPADLGAAVTYLSRVSEADAGLARRLQAGRAEVERLEREAEALVGEAEAALEEARAAHAEAVAVRARAEADHQALVVQARLLDGRIERLTASWAEERYRLAEQLVAQTGVTGALREETLRQASWRAALPLGPAEGVPPGLVPTGRVLQGVASWYGPGFHGRRASSGALFDQRDYTAAHKTLPFGTLLLVTYRGRRVVVVVNDRGPYVGERFLDLSRAAAGHLGLGLGAVTAEVLVPAPRG